MPKTRSNFTSIDLCLGIDPHPNLLADWGLSDSSTGVRDFAKITINSANEASEKYKNKEICLKPQLALFERQGSKGLAVLEELKSWTDLPIIMDAKRGDIGSTMKGYADAFVSPTAPFVCDALTVSPYLGVESTSELIKVASDNGKTIFLLCLTSNPEAYNQQHAILSDGNSLAKTVFNFAENQNVQFEFPTVGLVVGATIGDGAKKAGVNLSDFSGPLLSPGIGAQGAGKKELEDVFGQAIKNVIPSLSRGILKSGPKIDDLVNCIGDNLSYK
ncbi:MAG: orotidine-5'-phosphate decarboxylase [Candidatus Ancillula sp.]|jgi:orotidine-5'-phosphate decarboxylase|nr:orotidine-5'-phosphate decarboxylase [Candidatus Ancillula sp.]